MLEHTMDAVQEIVPPFHRAALLIGFKQIEGVERAVLVYCDAKFFSQPEDQLMS